MWRALGRPEASLFDLINDFYDAYMEDRDRNRVLALAFGHPQGAPPDKRGYEPRARRVLLLSATPLEADYRQLWNQLDLFGLGDAARDLGPQAEDVPEDRKRACAQQFLIRRLAHIPVAEQRLTKNLYRREWRAGGVAEHDRPLEVAGPDRAESGEGATTESGSMSVRWW